MSELFMSVNTLGKLFGSGYSWSWLVTQTFHVNRPVQDVLNWDIACDLVFSCSRSHTNFGQLSLW